MSAVLDDDFSDDGFIAYLPNTRDPGYAILVATIIFSFLSNAMIPCLVTLGRRYEKRRIALQERSNNNKLDDESNDVKSAGNAKDDEQEEQANFVNQVLADTGLEVVAVSRPPEEKEKDDAARYIPDSYVRNAEAVSNSWKNILDKIIMPPYADEGSLVGGSALVGVGRDHQHHQTQDETRSNVNSTHSASTSSSFWDSSILDAGYGTRTKTRRLRRQRRVLQDRELRKYFQKVEHEADKEAIASPNHIDRDGVEHGGRTGSDLLASAEVSSRVSSRVRGRSTVSGMSSANRTKRGHSPVNSVLSKLDDHVISPQDAPDANDPGFYILPPRVEGDDDVDFCCGEYAWWKPAVISAGFDRIIGLAEWDHEMKRIVQLCIPYSITALLEGVVHTIIVALVAQYLGTQAVAAFTLVQLILGLTSEFVGGILGTEATLCSHAIGVGNNKLAGQYVQASVFMYTLFTIPNVIVWSLFVDDVIKLFGFNEETAQMGQDYARVLVFQSWLVGVNYAYHGLLNVIGHENFSTATGVLEGICMVAATATLVVLRPHTNLQELGLVHLSVNVVSFLSTVWFTICKGWMNKFLGGMVGSLAITNRQCVRNVVRTAIPLSFGYLLEYSEWEVLTIFTAHLGPAEVATWGILGSLWDTFETLSKGIGDGGEVRCAYHLGNSNPGMAQISAYKSILLSLCASFFFTSILWMMGENVAVWFTPDPTLQNMIAELLPLLGVGNIALTAGCVSWALVGAQARYRLATLVALISSWGVTMPLAAAMTYGFRFNLQGVTSAVVIGYSVTCTVLFYILLRSDWERISKHVVELNDESDDESSVDSAVQRAEQQQSGL